MTTVKLARIRSGRVVATADFALDPSDDGACVDALRRLAKQHGVAAADHELRVEGRRGEAVRVAS